MQATLIIRNRPARPAFITEPLLPTSIDLHPSIDHESASTQTRLESTVITSGAVLNLYYERIRHFYTTFNSLLVSIIELQNDISNTRDHLPFLLASCTKLILHQEFNKRISTHLHALLSLSLYITNLKLELHEEKNVGPSIKEGIERDLKTLGVRVGQIYHNVEWGGYEVEKALGIWDGVWRGYLARENEEVYVHGWREGDPEFLVEKREEESPMVAVVEGGQEAVRRMSF